MNYIYNACLLSRLFYQKKIICVSFLDENICYDYYYQRVRRIMKIGDFENPHIQYSCNKSFLAGIFVN